MRKPQKSLFWLVTFVTVLILFVVGVTPTAYATEIDEIVDLAYVEEENTNEELLAELDVNNDMGDQVEDTTVLSIDEDLAGDVQPEGEAVQSEPQLSVGLDLADGELSEEGGTEEGGTEDDGTEDDTPIVKFGLQTEDGKIYYYNEDGTRFNGGLKDITVDGVTYRYFFEEDGTAFVGGYKEVVIGDKTYYFYFQENGRAFTDGYKPFNKDGTRVYFYFNEDGTAYTDGYLSFVVDGKRYYFFFQEDGSAFTGGYKEITIDDKVCYFYFLFNGQGYNTGYKTVTIDEKKYYFFFGENGQAVTSEMQVIDLGDRNAYMLFMEDGKAYTNGYKEIAENDKTDYYYFLANGQAFTTGYKTVTENGVTSYYFFQDDGKAFTDGLKEVPFGTISFAYFFQENGKAKTMDWQLIDEKNYYFQANGRAAKSEFVTIADQIYYFDDESTLAKNGWFSVDTAYYFADENGALTTNAIIEGYKLDEEGKCPTKYQVLTYVNKYTNSSMTDQQKIDALYNWLLTNSMNYIRTYEHTKNTWVWKDSWVDDMAASQISQWGGNCFRYAALLGMMVKEATGLPVTVYHGDTPGANTPLTPHGWITVEQNGQKYVYDVEMDKFTNYATSRLYKVPAEKSSLHLNGVGTNLF